MLKLQKKSIVEIDRKILTDVIDRLIHLLKQGNNKDLDDYPKLIS
jgi:hypothetical protein